MPDLPTLLFLILLTLLPPPAVALPEAESRLHPVPQAESSDLYRDLKIGQFTLSFRDLEVNASGIPIRVTRTYDTRRKNENLDFGYGWSVDYQSLQICLRPTGKRKVSITLPDGSLQRFEASNAQECGLSQIPPIDIRFTALPGTTGKLEIVNAPSLVQAQGGVLYDMDNLETWNPRDFKLTTEEGYVYHLSEGVGITRILDPYGNTLDYVASGYIEPPPGNGRRIYGSQKHGRFH